MLKNDHINEVWQAERGVVIPPGAIAYHLQSRQTYATGSRLKRSDCHGELFVCRKHFSIQLKEVPVTLRRDDAGLCIHLVWCSMDLDVSDLASVATWTAGTEEESLAYGTLEEELKPALIQALQDTLKYNLTTKQGQKAFESQAVAHIKAPEGLQIKGCVLRRVLTERDYLEEKKTWAGFEQALQRLASDRTVGEAAEQGRLRETLAHYENETVRALLTEQEKNLEVLQRVSRYMELLGPRSETPGAHAADPCPYPSCRQDLSVGRTFECRRCNNTVHAWHRSQANPELCERCHEAVRQGRTRVVAAVVILLALGGGVYGLWHVARGEKYVDPLALHWYGSGQRYEDGGWREFTLQNGITMYDGDEFRLTFIPNADCYVCVLCINSNGEVTQLFPNPAIRQGSSCQRGQVYEVPDGVNWFALDDQPGTETLFLVASYGSLKDLEDRLKQVVEGSLSQDAPRTVASAVQMIESRNEPDSDGQIRTTSGIVVRNVKIKPSRQVTTVGLKSGEQVERVMEFVQGRAGVVQRIQFVHLRAPESL